MPVPFTTDSPLGLPVTVSVASESEPESGPLPVAGRGVAIMIADAQTAKWQARYGRDPTDQQRAWLVNKVRTDIAMRATKLNVQVPGQLPA